MTKPSYELAFLNDIKRYVITGVPCDPHNTPTCTREGCCVSVTVLAKEYNDLLITLDKRNGILKKLQKS